MQNEFQFDQPEATDGLERWKEQRRMAATAIARKLHLPLGHEVEVYLLGNVRLRGKLLLKEERLFVEDEEIRHLQLTVDHVPFTSNEIESCVRMD